MEMVNAVGGGEGMVAGFAVRILRGYSMMGTICYAVALATANTRARATGSFLMRDLKTLLPQIRVEQID